MKPLVIYHDHCTDGFAAAFAAWLKLGDDAEYLPMQYGAIPEVQDLRDLVDEREVYVLDFSLPRAGMDEMFRSAKRVVWLDHHKTAFEMWCGTGQEAERVIREGRYEPTSTARSHENYICLDNNKSGALLAWGYFHPNTEAPMLFRHIDDRDRWQFKLDGSKELHAALQSYKPWNFKQWYEELCLTSPMKDERRYHYARLLAEGAAILRAKDQHVASMAKQARKCRIEFNVAMMPSDDQPTDIKFYEFRNGLACNASLHISELGHVLATQSGTYALIWYVAQDNRVKCSLRSNGDYDVSAIAKAFGGGGHKTAAGFETDINELMGWLR